MWPSFLNTATMLTVTRFRGGARLINCGCQVNPGYRSVRFRVTGLGGGGASICPGAQERHSGGNSCGSTTFGRGSAAATATSRSVQHSFSIARGINEAQGGPLLFIFNFILAQGCEQCGFAASQGKSCFQSCLDCEIVPRIRRVRA